MKQLSIGLMAHVDAGKTTLAEGILFRTGEIRKLGRVDHGDSWLDTNEIEKSRGITIFAHQASFKIGEDQFDLLDTPGHVDFSAEAERTMRVMDYAILVISGTDGVQSHTRTLWQLLERYQVPVILFVNKMDLSDRTETALIQELQGRLSSNCVQFDAPFASICENAAACSEELMAEYFETDSLSMDTLQQGIASRQIFPVCFGSARTLKGVESLIAILRDYTKEPPRYEDFAAQVFKISTDTKGNRLTFLKMMGGTLKNRAELRYTGRDHKEYCEKVTSVRYYSGAKYVLAEKEVKTGAVCAVTGLSAAYAGMGLGLCNDAMDAVLTPIMRYEVQLPDAIAPQTALMDFQQLEAEDPQLKVVWNEQNKAIYIQLMGAVQLEVLGRLAESRFGYSVSFDSGMVTYRETIADTVEGIGHYEPLRHYAEVHLLMSPLPPGSGMQFDTQVSEDVLDRNWQRLILTNMQEKTHIGVLTGAPITDMKLTLVSGRAHLKHTEGGDFRQAVYRAVRQGLRSAESVLLEPYYAFTLELPADGLGRAMMDIQQRAGSFEPPEILGENAVLNGTAPAAEMNDYGAEVLSYTKGKGVLTLNFDGYRPCHNAEEVIERIGYQADSDLENTADSVFCSHGAGYLVNWAEVPMYMHLPAVLPHRFDFIEEEIKPISQPKPDAYTGASEDELMAIYERTYGKIQREPRKAMRRNKVAEQIESHVKIPPLPEKEYLLVDGYNIIHGWDSLKKLAEGSLDFARDALLARLQNYQGYRKCEVILVFDAYKLKGHRTEVEQHGAVSVVYTKEAETADSYIERVSKQLLKKNRVRVATSDGLEQLIILGNGAIRISAREFEAEVSAAEQEIRSLIGGGNSGYSNGR
ncbi:MAG: TetM/TetW/TetO/TetS family tetracycline resistance ribosomal protection protein [Oscillospiraceae bacterium]|nr:TetM/TetW/TetO/TetS family tetracycline resistance ribosomal protection protein [Oscillospiraceae bacterium]